MISIVIPVYQVAKLLSRCIESVLAQTYADWELILIDDGSYDESCEICDKYAIKDPRIRVIHQKNSGVSNARNRGIEEAKGDFLTFVDADDYLLPEFLERVNEEEADLLICGFVIKNSITFSPRNLTSIALYENSYLNEILENPYYLDSPWCKIYKTRIIKQNHIKFDEKLKLSEDTLFNYMYLIHCEKLSAISDNLYFYDGIWGGTGKKYELSYEDLFYISKRLTDSLEIIKKKFNIKINIINKGFHLSKLQNLFTDYTDTKIFELYTKTHSTKLTIFQFLGNPTISPLTDALILSKEKILKENTASSIKFMNTVKKFINTPISKIDFQNNNHKLFFFILKYLGPYSLLYLVKLFNRLNILKK